MSVYKGKVLAITLEQETEKNLHLSTFVHRKIGRFTSLPQFL